MEMAAKRIENCSDNGNMIHMVQTLLTWYNSQYLWLHIHPWVYRIKLTGDTEFGANRAQPSELP